MIYIRNTDHIFTPKDAKKWLREHTVIAKKDLKRIAALAKKLGFYEEPQGPEHRAQRPDP